MKTPAQEKIDELKAQGYDKVQIIDAICDGEFLKAENIDKETAEEVYNILVF